MSKQTVAVALSLAALAAGQSLSNLSKECQAGINGLSSNSDASSCLALNQFTNIFLTADNTSVIAPVTNWLTAFCGAPVCSNSTIETVLDSLTTACATDITALGATADQAQSIIPYVQQYFGTAKEVLCLANTSSDQFCATELANAAEKDLGKPLSIDNLVSTLGGVVASGQSPVNTAIACTACTQGIIAILHDDPLIGSSVSSGLESTCGSDFVASATSLPTNIVVGTGTAVPKGSGGSDGGDGAATLAVAATFATVAGSLLVAFLA